MFQESLATGIWPVTFTRKVFWLPLWPYVKILNAGKQPMAQKLMICILMAHYQAFIMIHIYISTYISSIFQSDISEYQKDMKSFFFLKYICFFYCRQLNSIAGHILSLSPGKSPNFNSIIIKTRAQKKYLGHWVQLSSDNWAINSSLYFINKMHLCPNCS